MIALDLLTHIQEAVLNHIQRGKFVVTHFISFSIAEKEDIVECTGVFKDMTERIYSFQAKLDKRRYQCLDIDVTPYMPKPTVDELIADAVKNSNANAEYARIQADIVSITATSKILNAGLYGITLGWICAIILQLVESLTGINNHLVVKNILDFSIIVAIVFIYRYILINVCKNSAIGIPSIKTQEKKI